MAAAFVGAVALLTAFVVPGFAFPNVPPPPAPVSWPTAPTIEPLERTGEVTALTQALPDSVFHLAQRGIENYDQWQSENRALESWAVLYAASEDPGAASVALTVGQWAEESAATSFAEAQMRAAGAPTRTGDVRVGTSVVGTFSIFNTGPGAGPGARTVIWWRNGTVVLRAEGPANLVTDFYTAFPL